MYAAAQGGFLEIIHWLYGNGHPADAFLASAAARGGSIEVLLWLHLKELLMMHQHYICHWLAENGHVEALKVMKDLGYPWNESIIATDAIFWGKLNVLMWMKEIGCDLTDGKFTEMAAKAGHIKILKWLREGGCSWDPVACFEKGIEGESVEVLDSCWSPDLQIDRVWVEYAQFWESANFEMVG